MIPGRSCPCKAGVYGMEIQEMKLRADARGCLLIPAQVLQEMGLRPGDEIYAAYAVDGSGRNRWKEFLLTGEGLTADHASELAVPDVLLAQAGIPPDADLQLICLNGSILITQDTALTETELSVLLDDLRSANEIAAQLPDNESALDCLTDALERAERELYGESER